MPGTAAEVARTHPAATDAEPRPSGGGNERDLDALDWSEVARLLVATDDDDVPLFGRLPG